MGKSNKSRRCPKCGGNLYIDRDHNGWYEQCLQCAYMRDLRVVYETRKKAGTASHGRA
jgi:DNA-directed RNA polymerase subunit M/transcription elongation factor TFIIS